MFRQLIKIKNDILRVSGYLVSYPATHFFHLDMREKLDRLKRELEDTELYLESIEEEQ